MAQLITHIPLTPQYYTFTNTSYSYAQNNYSQAFLYTAANWDGTIEIKLEAIVSVTSGNTVYVALTDTSNNVLASSEISSSSTTKIKINSAALSLSDGTEYRINVKVSGGTGTIYNARLIIKQSGTITKTETHILLDSSAGYSVVGDSAYHDVNPEPIFTYNASEWDGISAIYFETLYYGSNSCIIALYDSTNSRKAANAVNSLIMGRSADIKGSFVDGRTYRIEWRNNNGATNTYNLCYAKLVIVQTNLTKGIKYNHINTLKKLINSTNYVETGQSGYYDANEQDVASITRALQGTLQEFGGTGYIDLNDGSNSIGELSADTINFTSLTSSPTFVDDTIYNARGKNTTTGNTFIGIVRIVETISQLASALTTYTKTCTAKVRIKTAAIEKTVTSKTRIKKINNTKTITAKNRILSTGTIHNITSKIDIKKLNNTKTVSAKENIIKVGPWDETREYEIITGGVRFTVTATAKVKITALFNWEEDSDIWSFIVAAVKTINTKSRILKLNNQTISTKICIFKQISQTVNAKSRIKILNNTKTCTTKVHILTAGITKTITAKTRIKKLIEKTITAKIRVKTANNKTITAKCRIKTLNIKTISAKTRIKQANIFNTVTAKVLMKLTGVTTSIAAKVRILNTQIKTINAKTKIVYDVWSKTVQSKTRIKREALSKTITAKVKIYTIIENNVSAKTRIKKVMQQTVIAKTSVVFLKQQTITAKVRIVKLISASIKAKTRILSSGITKIISAKTRVSTHNLTKIITTKTRIKHVALHTIAAKTYLWVRILNTKAVSAKVDIFNINEKTISAKTRLVLQPPYGIKVAHGVGVFNKIYDVYTKVGGKIFVKKSKEGKIYSVIIHKN